MILYIFITFFLSFLFSFINFYFSIYSIRLVIIIIKYYKLVVALQIFPSLRSISLSFSLYLISIFCFLSILLSPISLWCVPKSSWWLEDICWNLCAVSEVALIRKSVLPAPVGPLQIIAVVFNPFASPLCCPPLRKSQAHCTKREISILISKL